jgi:hypothetical protein
MGHGARVVGDDGGLTKNNSRCTALCCAAETLARNAITADRAGSRY